MWVKPERNLDDNNSIVASYFCYTRTAGSDRRTYIRDGLT